MKRFVVVFIALVFLSGCASRPPAVSGEQEQLLTNVGLIMKWMSSHAYSNSENLIERCNKFYSEHPIDEVYYATSDAIIFILERQIETADIHINIVKYADLHIAYYGGNSSTHITELIQQTKIILEKINALQLKFDEGMEFAVVLSLAQKYNYNF